DVRRHAGEGDRGPAQRGGGRADAGAAIRAHRGRLRAARPAGESRRSDPAPAHHPGRIPRSHPICALDGDHGPRPGAGPRRRPDLEAARRRATLPEGADGGGPDRDEPPSRRAAQEVRDPLRLHRLRADRRAARPSVPPRRRGDGHRLLARDLLDLLDRTDRRREPRRQGDHLPDGRDVGDQRGLPGPGRLGVQPSGEGGVDHSGRRVGRPVLHPSDRRGPRHRGRHATEAGLMRIRILDRYVLSEFLRLFLLFAAAAPVLFILGDVTDNLDRHLNRGYTAVQILLNYVYQVPLFVLYSFPIASLIASVFTVNSMTRYSEVTAAKAGGVSFYRLYAPLPILGVVLTVAGLGISELGPIAERARGAAPAESANR